MKIGKKLETIFLVNKEKNTKQHNKFLFVVFCERKYKNLNKNY